MFAELWEKDHLSKCKREEMEAAMQLERNREMLRVSGAAYINTYQLPYVQVLNLQTAALEKQKEEIKQLREQEGELLVRY